MHARAIDLGCNFIRVAVILFIHIWHFFIHIFWILFHNIECELSNNWATKMMLRFLFCFDRCRAFEFRSTQKRNQSIKFRKKNLNAFWVNKQCLSIEMIYWSDLNSFKTCKKKSQVIIIKNNWLKCAVFFLLLSYCIDLGCRRVIYNYFIRKKCHLKQTIQMMNAIRLLLLFKHRYCPK